MFYSRNENSFLVPCVENIPFIYVTSLTCLRPLMVTGVQRRLVGGGGVRHRWGPERSRQLWRTESVTLESEEDSVDDFMAWVDEYITGSTKNWIRSYNVGQPYFVDWIKQGSENTRELDSDMRYWGRICQCRISDANI